MSVFESLIFSGRIVDLMIVFLVLEIVGIAWLRKFRGVGIPVGPLLVNIGAGGSIMLALRAALTNAGWQWITLFLVSALVFHVSDLAIRWQTASGD